MLRLCKDGRIWGQHNSYRNPQYINKQRIAKFKKHYPELNDSEINALLLSPNLLLSLRGNHARPLISKVCLYCNKEFTTNVTARKFCSRSCASSYNNSHGGGFSGKHRSEKWKGEHAIKVSRALKGRPKTKEHIEALRRSRTGLHYNFGPKSEKHKKALSESRKRGFVEGKLVSWNKGMNGYHNKKPYPPSHRNSKARTNISNGILKWYKEMSVEKKQQMFRNQTKALHIRPNKCEIYLGKLIEIACPKQYIYTGDGSLMISGYAPDYTNIDGQKKVIEMFGNYWHGDMTADWKGTELGRMMLFNYFGFKCLIVWEKELKFEDEVLVRIKKFND